jgi:hypothetical protein
MRIPRITFLVSTILLFSFLVVGFAQKSAYHSVPWLAREVGLTTPLTVNAGTEEHALKHSCEFRLMPTVNQTTPQLS